MTRGHGGDRICCLREVSFLSSTCWGRKSECEKYSWCLPSIRKRDSVQSFDMFFFLFESFWDTVKQIPPSKMHFLFHIFCFRYVWSKRDWISIGPLKGQILFIIRHEREHWPFILSYHGEASYGRVTTEKCSREDWMDGRSGRKEQAKDENELYMTFCDPLAWYIENLQCTAICICLSHCVTVDISTHLVIKGFGYFFKMSTGLHKTYRVWRSW